jgi:dipeptide/tripeptide permease
MTERMRFNERGAVAIYHSFVCLAYVMPVFGAVVADGFLGKYRLVCFISLVCCYILDVVAFVARAYLQRDGWQTTIEQFFDLAVLVIVSGVV